MLNVLESIYQKNSQFILSTAHQKFCSINFRNNIQTNRSIYLNFCKRYLFVKTAKAQHESAHSDYAKASSSIYKTGQRVEAGHLYLKCGGTCLNLFFTSPYDILLHITAKDSEILCEITKKRRQQCKAAIGMKFWH